MYYHNDTNLAKFVIFFSYKKMNPKSLNFVYSAFGTALESESDMMVYEVLSIQERGLCRARMPIVNCLHIYNYKWSNGVGHNKQDSLQTNRVVRNN